MNSSFDFLWHCYANPELRILLKGSRKLPSGHLEEEDFMLGQVTFSNHLPARQALTHSMK